MRHFLTALLPILLFASGCDDSECDCASPPAATGGAAGSAPDGSVEGSAGSGFDGGADAPVTDSGEAATEASASSLSIYPGLPDDLYRSPKYTVTVDSQDSYVYETVNDNSPGAYGLLQYANHWSSFSFSGAVTVKVQAKDKQQIAKAFLRPGNRKLDNVSGNTVSFTLDKPGNYYVEIDDDMSLDPLFVFANPPEVGAPSPSDPAVVELQPGAHDPATLWQGRTVAYFGPGLHDLGTTQALRVPAGNRVHLAGGAYVKGILYLEEGTGTVVSGRGILSGIDYPATSWGNTPMVDGLRWGATMKVQLEGITLVDAPGINAFVEGSDESEVVYDNLKLMAWGDMTDGLGGAPNTVIRNCFLKVYDDQLHLTLNNVRLYDNVVWMQGQGSAVQMGWNPQDSTTFNEVKGLYIIHDNMHTSGFDDDHRNSNIVSMREIRAGAVRANIVFDNIVQEGGNLYQAIGIRINEPWFGGDYGQGNGTVTNLTFRNCTIGGMPRYRSVFNGEGSVPGTQITGVHFENVTIGGQLLTASNASTFLDIQNQCSDFTYSP